MFRECFTLKLTELSIKPITGRFTTEVSSISLQTVNNRFSIERSSTYKSFIRSQRFCYSIGLVDWMQSHLHTNRHWFTTIVVDLILIKMELWRIASFWFEAEWDVRDASPCENDYMFYAWFIWLSSSSFMTTSSIETTTKRLWQPTTRVYTTQQWELLLHWERMKKKCALTTAW